MPHHQDHRDSADLTLHQRRRDPTPTELAGIPWLAVLQPAEREVAVRHIKVGDALTGDYVCRIGRPVTYWFGVVEGLLKMSSENAGPDHHLQRPAAGRLVRRGHGAGAKSTATTSRRCAGVVAGLPADTFPRLLDHSIGFNRFVMNQRTNGWRSSSPRARSTA